MKDVRDHIRSIPRMDSHYCQSKSTKEYTEGGKSIADLHRDYLTFCEEPNKLHANYMMYATIFKEEFSIYFLVPKKDICHCCEGFRKAKEEENVTLQERYNRHIEEKELCRLDKESHKMCLDKVVTVFDLQSTLPYPQGESSSFYYVSKLNVYNFTMYELQSTQAIRFVWHEGLANRGANEIGSCLWHYLENINTKPTTKLDVVLYSDNCVGQNKNILIFALYVHAVSALENINSITHKFFITGHTQNEGDAVHPIVERAAKRFKRTSPIYVPDNYVITNKQVKKHGKIFDFHEMCYTNFFDMKLLAEDLGVKGVFSNEVGDRVHISGVSVVKTTKDNYGQLDYKTSYTQEIFQTAKFLRNKRQPTAFKKVSLKRMYTQKVGVAAKKKESLLSLFNKKSGVSVMPQYYKDFYQNL
ncbi:hypothetical protein PR048_002708 [Dryococelus australis]|uniref:DUF7869 domain-containing protein n=1 Tax=Dryococelus australis TaxID=614101 RepID=A0ABQ9IKZ3_9NEOP|nr:hypothetical protein PR048_002708 [Dryococelus australis]